MLSVFTREWLSADVAVRGGHVVGLGTYRGEVEIDCGGAYVVPGLIDAHVHLESSKLLPHEFARAVLPHGTTTVVTDPHEIANVLGPAGVRWLLEVCAELPIDVFVMAPSCVPASSFESPLRAIGPSEIAQMLDLPGVIGVAEMMNYPGVIAGDPGELEKLAGRLGEHVDGHAPGVGGRALNAYLAAGIRSDHEASTAGEALEKRRLGAWIMLREASPARNLRDLLPMVREHGPDRCMFCTDDREPGLIMAEGHINQMLRIAVAEGVAPEDALVMATRNPAEYHRLHRHGALAPGFWADALVLDDLVGFRPRLVLKRGVVPEPVAGVAPDWVRQTMNAAPVTAASFEIPAGPGPIRVIGVVPGQLLTTAEVAEPARRRGLAVADPGRDLLKIAVVERHHATGRVGLGFVTGVGLGRGAYASTVAHDAHNVVVIGADDAAMAACVSRLGELGGGIAVADGGRVVGELALPVAGLMSDRPLAAVAGQLAALERLLMTMGVSAEAPFMTLSFLALSVIPELKISDRGLVDVARARLVSLSLG